MLGSMPVYRPVYIAPVHVYLVMDDQCWLCFSKSHSYTCVRFYTVTCTCIGIVNMEPGMNVEAIGLLTKSVIYGTGFLPGEAIAKDLARCLFPAANTRSSRFFSILSKQKAVRLIRRCG